MSTLTITPANVSASEERGAVIVRYIAGEQLSMAHPAVYLDDNNKVHPAVANSTLTKARAIGVLVWPNSFYGGENTVASGDWASICIFGPVWVGPNTLLIDGKELWVGKTGTAGDIVDTAPTTPAYQFALGRAEGNDTIFVNPGTTAPVSV